MIIQSALSTRYVQVPFASLLGSEVPYDPTSSVVQMAFMPVDSGTGQSANPGTGDWHTGSWITPFPGDYRAQCLVGPAGGAITLTEGEYRVWMKIEGSPETPIEPVATLAIDP